MAEVRYIETPALGNVCERLAASLSSMAGVRDVLGTVAAYTQGCYVYAGETVYAGDLAELQGSSVVLGQASYSDKTITLS